MMRKKKFEKEYFGGWYKRAVGNFTKEDLRVSNNWFWSWLKKLNQYVPVEKGEGRSVLEIGCSIGSVTNLLSARGFKVWASDVSEYAVKNAKKLTPKATFLTIDVQKKIPLKKKFDIIIAFEVVEHLDDPQKAIVNMYNSLDKGGVLVFSSPYPHAWNYRDPTHINVKYPHEWVKMMKRAGLKKVAFHRFTLLPFFYRFNKRFQVVIPFAIPNSYLNNPIFFIGYK